MLESSNKFRAKFAKPSLQTKWLTNLTNRIPVSHIATLCSCSERTIRDWRRAKFLIPYDSLEKICSTHSILFPKVQRVSRFAHVQSAGRKGGLKTVTKYGGVPVNESVRKERWRTWWNAIGRHLEKLPTQPYKIKKPRKSATLAEFIGIMMGDGTVSTYHTSVTLHAIDDKAYSVYVTALMNGLFHIQPKIYRRKDSKTLVITIARTLLTQYLHELGLPIGNKIKQGLSVPSWIITNPHYARACMRGLMDTDGSVFTHTYLSKGKTYTYKKLSFTSASERLRDDVHRILNENNIRSGISKTNVRIDSKEAVIRYWQTIGSHNPKHLKRFTE